MRDDVVGKGACEKARRLARARRELNPPDRPPQQRAALAAEHDRLVDEFCETGLDGE